MSLSHVSRKYKSFEQAPGAAYDTFHTTHTGEAKMSDKIIETIDYQHYEKPARLLRSQAFTGHSTAPMTGKLFSRIKNILKNISSMASLGRHSTAAGRECRANAAACA